MSSGLPQCVSSPTHSPCLSTVSVGQESGPNSILTLLSASPTVVSRSSLSTTPSLRSTTLYVFFPFNLMLAGGGCHTTFSPFYSSVLLASSASKHHAICNTQHATRANHTAPTYRPTCSSMTAPTASSRAPSRSMAPPA